MPPSAPPTTSPASPRAASAWSSARRCRPGLRITEGVARVDVAALDLPEARIADLVHLGLLADDPDRLRATPAGRLVLDRLTLELAS
jgi:coproporphyrinogen III oxidase-like Fe-S oxidoreductase